MNKQLILRGTTNSIVIGLPLMLSGPRAFADSDIIPHAMARFEHSSNLLLVPDSKPQQDSNGVPRFEDQFVEYDGGIDINYRFREDRLYFVTDFSRFSYQHFTRLDHDGFTGTGGLDWVATRKITGNISYDYNRHQLPFESLLNAKLVESNIETTQAYRASANYAMNSRWAVDLNISSSSARLPNTGNTSGLSYDMHQTGERVGITFTGATKLRTGVLIDHQSGNYQDKNQPEFANTTYEYRIDYKLGARTNVGSTLGYTQRSQQGADSNAMVGSLNFNQRITEKTNYYVQIQRSLDTYNTAAGSQLNTSGTFGVSWQATTKIGLNASYGYTKAHIVGVLDATAVVKRRDDTLRAIETNLQYVPLRWLTITPYYRYQSRSSDNPDSDFNATTYGVTIGARFNP
jgi:hypothetical protein